MRLAVIATPAAWALRHHARSALALALVVAIAAAAAVPGLVLSARLELTPIRDAAWGTGWTSLAVRANVARVEALDALAGAISAAGAAVLLVAAFTVLSLSVARSAQRRSDVVVRRAVGASRAAIAGAALVEGGVIAFAGAAVGAAGAMGAALMLARGWPGAITAFNVVPLFWLLGLGGVVVLGALLPLGFARRRAPGGDATGRGVPLLVPATQFGLGLLGLLAGAQLARRTPVVPSALVSEANGVIIPLSLGGDAPVVLGAALARLRADSRVSLVSLTSPGTLIGLGQVDVITTECGRCVQGGIATPLRVVQATNHLATADTFRAMGLRVIDGRTLSDADRWGTAPVAVVNRYLAERAFESGRAVGRQVRVGGPDRWYRVVGIVEDGRFDAIGAGSVPRPRVFLSALQHEASELDLLVRGADGAAAAGIPGAALGHATTEHDVLVREHQAARWFARTLTYQGWGAVLLTALGMLAAMRLWVTGVLPDLALRRAVGAQRRQVWWFVTARALAVAGGGAALAWWLEPLGSAALARAVAGVPPGDLMLVRGPLVALFVVTLVAVAGPAWRAARAAPATLPGFSDL